MSDRDQLNRRVFTKYEKARNKVKNLVIYAKKLYCSKIVKNGKDTSSASRFLNSFTKGTHSRQKKIPQHFAADVFNDYFLSIIETLFIKSRDSLT